MRISASNIVGACFSAAILAACGGSGPSSTTPMSVTPQIAVPLGQSPTGVTAERTHLRPAYNVLYSFKGGSGDGASREAALLDVNGTLYGTTSYGGANNDGAVFAITPTGTETVLHSFNGSDGRSPQADLLNVNGTLYGATSEGGDCSSIGCGTVYSITTAGTKTVLHSFAGGKAGAYPYAGLINVKGTLYGTTEAGGAYCSASYGCGTVFAIKPSGKEIVLHSFGGSGDGESPYASLLDVNGTLYGTTGFGAGRRPALGVGAGPSSRSRRPARKPCSIVSAARRTAQSRMRAS